ncbi:Rho termination factor N-terminal domain-containing protein [Thermobifida halotolerans]|uniref:Rho termination factor N-terminal domain-containing protein n=1 Tax=Thermobifida halotolerans TaxID=483545 RepID=A0AA97LZT5_9ACTN|nr:Rho termination factor N-terminal domain-containing protein [Thermobifida halotolerans]UOE21185.1 Rho termination factor N-terminal domain-containing protein [Thermobifida halotolerans]
MAEHQNPHAQHGDQRVEALREKYGDLANLTVDELQERARQQGVKSPSGLRKEELLETLTGKGR